MFKYGKYTRFLNIYATKVKNKKGLLDMFPNGKWQNSTLMNSFQTDTENFLHSKVLPSSLEGSWNLEGPKMEIQETSCFCRLHIFTKYVQPQISRNILPQNLAGGQSMVILITKSWLYELPNHGYINYKIMAILITIYIYIYIFLHIPLYSCIFPQN